MDKGASLSLHAVANRIIDDYMTEGGQTNPQLAALHLVALSCKSLHNPQFAPTNTRVLVKAWRSKAIDQLKEGAAAGGSSAEAPYVLEEAQRLKELGQALQACAGVELRHVQNKRAARQFVSWFELGAVELARWEQQQQRSGNSARSGKASLPPSPSALHRRRSGKRKTPERSSAGPSRFAPGPGGSPAACDERPRRRRTSSSKEAAEGASAAAGLQAKQLCFDGQTQSSSSARQDAHAGAEWRALEAPLGPLCRPEEHAAEAAASPASAMQHSAAMQQGGCAPACTAPMDGVQQQVSAECMQQWEQQGDAMDMESVLVAAVKTALEASTPMESEGGGSSTSCGADSEVSWQGQPAAGACTVGLPLSPRTRPTPQGPTSPLFSPDCWAALGLLQPWPPAAGKENSSCCPSITSTVAASATGVAGTPPCCSSCQEPRHASLLGHPAAPAIAAERAAEAADLIRADVMLLISESDAGEATTTGSEMSAPSRHALCQARQLARQTASAAAQQQPRHGRPCNYHRCSRVQPRPAVNSYSMVSRPTP
ncbi:hypothetical protein ABPG77_007963 [Micractinium sp. CCAP 211/92]